jgi:hypothetical protein
VTVFVGGDLQQDLAPAGGATPPSHSKDSQDYSNPAAVPNGEWASGFNVVGGTNYYWLPAQANRTLSVEVETFDENQNATETKAQPVIGIWAMADPPGTPPAAATPSPFNTIAFAGTRLDAQIIQSTNFRIGITDWRGDARPDYTHHVRVLYGDTITPTRISAAGGNALTVQGLGFRPGMTSTVGTVSAQVADFSFNQLLLLAPALADGLQTVVVSDPATGGFSTLTDVVTAGAGATDTIVLLPVANPAIPVGGTTPNALQFLVVQADGVTPVPGATVALRTTNGLTLAACGGTTACSVFSDQSGRVVTNAGVTAAGPGQVTAQLAPASYPNPSTAATTLVGTASTLDIALSNQVVAVEQGTSPNAPLIARVLNNGSPLAGIGVDFQVTTGHGVLQAFSVSTDSNGYATNSIKLTRVAADVQVAACVVPANAPCNTFTLNAVPVNVLLIEAVSGVQQVLTFGQSPQLVNVRITDGASPPNPVLGATVTFQNVLSRGGSGGQTIIVDGEVVRQPSDPVILGAAKTLLATDVNGMAQLAPWASPVAAGEQVDGFAIADSGAKIVFSLDVLPALPAGGLPGSSNITDKRQRSQSALPIAYAPHLGEFNLLTPAPPLDLGTVDLSAVDPGTLDSQPDGDVTPKQDEDKEAQIGKSLPKKTSTTATPMSAGNYCEQCSGKSCSVLQ